MIALTPTISLLEAIWTLLALIGALRYAGRASRYWQLHRALVQTGQNGALQYTSLVRIRTRLTLLIMLELLVAIGVVAMTLPPTATVSTWPISISTLVHMGLLGLLLWYGEAQDLAQHRLQRLVADVVPADPAHPRVLIVDDQAVIRDLFAAALRRAGYEPLTRPDARDLLGTVARYRPACIILDLLLPGIAGDTAAAALRALGDPTPIILYTAQWPASTVASLDEWAADLGVQAVLIKGASPRPLDDMLAQVTRLVPREEG